MHAFKIHSFSTKFKCVSKQKKKKFFYFINKEFTLIISHLNLTPIPKKTVDIGNTHQFEGQGANLCPCCCKRYCSLTQLYELTGYPLLDVPSHSDQPAKLFGWPLPNSFWAKWIILKVWSSLACFTLAEADGAELVLPEKGQAAEGHKILHSLSWIQRPYTHSWSQQMWKNITALLH